MKTTTKKTTKKSGAKLKKASSPKRPTFRELGLADGSVFMERYGALLEKHPEDLAREELLELGIVGGVNFCKDLIRVIESYPRAACALERIAANKNGGTTPMPAAADVSEADYEVKS